MPRVPPRIYCIPATRAPVVAVFLRGPTNWSHVGRWDLAAGRYEPGSWLRGRLFPRRSDLSPDGKYLCYFAHNPKAEWELGESYVAVSRLPWLTALHAFRTTGTWTRGYRFAESGAPDDDLESFPIGLQLEIVRAGDFVLPIPYVLRSWPIITFAIEHERGWSESSDSDPRVAGGVFDEQRSVRMERRQPGGDLVLHMDTTEWQNIRSSYAAATHGMPVDYWLASGSDLEVLDDLQWADWDASGNLLVATRSGTIQSRRMRANGFDVLFEEDLSVLVPEPAAPPGWASRW